MSVWKKVFGSLEVASKVVGFCVLLGTSGYAVFRFLFQQPDLSISYYSSPSFLPSDVSSVLERFSAAASDFSVAVPAKHRDVFDEIMKMPGSQRLAAYGPMRSIQCAEIDVSNNRTQDLKNIRIALTGVASFLEAEVTATMMPDKDASQLQKLITVDGYGYKSHTLLNIPSLPGHAMVRYYIFGELNRLDLEVTGTESLAVDIQELGVVPKTFLVRAVTDNWGWTLYWIFSSCLILFGWPVANRFINSKNSVLKASVSGQGSEDKETKEEESGAPGASPSE